jgi:hypothetical protein
MAHPKGGYLRNEDSVNREVVPDEKTHVIRARAWGEGEHMSAVRNAHMRTEEREEENDQGRDCNEQADLEDQAWRGDHIRLESGEHVATLKNQGKARSDTSFVGELDRDHSTSTVFPGSRDISIVLRKDQRGALAQPRDQQATLEDDWENPITAIYSRTGSGTKAADLKPRVLQGDEKSSGARETEGMGSSYERERGTEQETVW